MSTQIKVVPTISFHGLLAILFIGLKLTGYTHWSWWWVLSPLWAVPLLFVAMILAMSLFGAAVLGVAALLTRRG